MSRLTLAVASLLVALCPALPLAAQQSSLVANAVVAPNVTKYSAVLIDLNGRPITGIPA